MKSPRERGRENYWRVIGVVPIYPSEVSLRKILERLDADGGEQMRTSTVKKHLLDAAKAGRLRRMGRGHDTRWSQIGAMP